ncbi:hypothetical protein cyc_07268 [Cyclospora cayetanensis]|uniref:Uncharacterized protein n=1 Tax=Cyclospora cayetanensis TaxID=88456 RepID=A0A1D3D2T2_9EIME|nr:hypothetical protein cyc_07268 [Cyclospora cayetanensis]
MAGIPAMVAPCTEPANPLSAGTASGPQANSVASPVELASKAEVKLMHAAYNDFACRKALEEQLKIWLGAVGASLLLELVDERYKMLKNNGHQLPKGYKLPVYEHLECLPIVDLWLVAEKLKLAAAFSKRHNISVAFQGAGYQTAPRVIFTAGLSNAGPLVFPFALPQTPNTTLPLGMAQVDQVVYPQPRRIKNSQVRPGPLPEGWWVATAD